jgi:hypothetical protein
VGPAVWHTRLAPASYWKGGAGLLKVVEWPWALATLSCLGGGEVHLTQGAAVHPREGAWPGGH